MIEFQQLKKSKRLLNILIGESKLLFRQCLSGIRIGAWDYLQWGHVRPIKKDGEVAAAKLIVYAGEDEEYFTFISREAWLALNDWMDYRTSSGESITDNSWVMRDRTSVIWGINK